MRRCLCPRPICSRASGGGRSRRRNGSCIASAASLAALPRLRSHGHRGRMLARSASCLVAAAASVRTGLHRCRGPLAQRLWIVRSNWLGGASVNLYKIRLAATPLPAVAQQSPLVPLLFLLFRFSQKFLPNQSSLQPAQFLRCTCRPVASNCFELSCSSNRPLMLNVSATQSRSFAH